MFTHPLLASSIIITGVPPMSSSPPTNANTGVNGNTLSTSPSSSNSNQMNKDKGMNGNETSTSELVIANKKDLSSVVVNFISSNDGSLKDLILDATQLEDDGIINIVNTLKATANRPTTSKLSPIYLERIVLSENLMTGIGIQSVMDFINTPLARELNTLFLDNNPVIGNETVLQSLCKAMSINSSITVLSIAGCHITNSGAEMLGKMLTLNGNLNSLCIDNNKIGNKGVQAVANALLVNISLQELHLEGNDIGEPALSALVHSLLNNHTLIQLSVSPTESFINAPNAPSLLDTINNLLERNRNPKLKLFNSRSEPSPNPVIQIEPSINQQDMHESTDQGMASAEYSNRFSSIGVVPKPEALIVQELKPEDSSAELLSSSPSDGSVSSFIGDTASRTKRYQITSSGNARCYLLT